VDVARKWKNINRAKRKKTKTPKNKKVNKGKKKEMKSPQRSRS
jgi:hypothetical protein